MIGEQRNQLSRRSTIAAASLAGSQSTLLDMLGLPFLNQCLMTQRLSWLQET